MTGPPRTFPHACALAASALLASACGAVAPDAPAAEGEGPRLLVRVTDRSADGAAVARLAADAAGAPVEHLSVSGSGWHAVRLRCTGRACDAALARLRQSTQRPGPIEAVEPDGRKRPA
jgi:hypothetical protein